MTSMPADDANHASTASARTAVAPEAAADVRLARVHLRLGQLTLARAELEDLLRRDRLDAASLASLAEARWRTGDEGAAADAAQAHLDAGGADDVALCIAAEAAAAEGRSADARALMELLPSSDTSSLDELFAGMPRRAVWPAGPVDRSDLDDLRQHVGREALPGRRSLAPSRPTAASGTRAAELAGTGADPGAIPGPREVLAAGGWQPRGQAGGGPEVRRGRPGERRVKGQLDPAAELARARAELGSRPERAFLRLALVLRHDPTLAPMVLETLHLRREPTAALLRGDAQRLLGRHLEAEAAFDAAAEYLEVT
ncbi:MAG TPA: hypothetical protein VMQ65_08850 [Candidatus Limnocylindria bacterium]|nr:hypothetical protein [Candidatus Limnocylindria bacterium]